MHHGTGAPYLIVAPRGPRMPVVLSSPHSGQSYPPELLAQARLAPEKLRALDDGPVDELLARACAAGATLIGATYPRAVVDLNRDADEQDPATLDLPAAAGAGLRATLKARAGLGVVPTRLLGEPIYPRPLSVAELERRIETAYLPYHVELSALAADRRRRFGASLILDCHSMPTLPAGRGERAIDVALGDRFGRSCHPLLVEVAERRLTAVGLRVARNRPYAGGHITERHGEPGRGSHALQIELRRGLFMDERSHERREGFVALQTALADLVTALSDALLGLVAAAAPVAADGRALRSA